MSRYQRWTCPSPRRSSPSDGVSSRHTAITPLPARFTSTHQVLSAIELPEGSQGAGRQGGRTAHALTGGHLLPQRWFPTFANARVRNTWTVGRLSSCPRLEGPRLRLNRR